MKISGLYFVTDSNLTSQGILSDVKQVIEAGCRIVQYREKGKKTAEMLKEATSLKETCKKNGVLFIVNDRVDIALAVDADGVHLGQKDMPVAAARKLLGEKIIGTSNHSLEQAKKSLADNADYLSVGPIFHTDTKKDAGKPVGLSLLAEVRAITDKPLVAIGGINQENLEQVLEAKPDAVAMISAIVCSENPGETANRLVKKIGAEK